MPSYHDISSVYFRSLGVTEPVAIHRGVPVQPGACPVRVWFYVSRSDLQMGGGPACFKGRSGNVQRCCGATSSQTDDSPQTVFDRIVAVLEKDGFYSLAESTQPAPSDGAAFYSIAVMRCGARELHRGVSIAFIGPPQPAPNTSILSLRVPFATLPEALYDPKLVTLFDDLTHAIYQSNWAPGDVW